MFQSSRKDHISLVTQLYLESQKPGFSLGRLHMRGGFVPPYGGGGQVQGNKALMTHKIGHRPYGRGPNFDRLYHT